jgi:hypothetical protein
VAFQTKGARKRRQRVGFVIDDQQVRFLRHGRWPQL